jgi:cytidylate kinase
MGYRAVAMSQVYGSGAESIGRDVARQLGFGYLNEAIVAQVASDRGVDQAVVSEAEQRRSFFSRLAEMAARAAPDVTASPPLYKFDETDMLLSLIRDAVRDAADRGNVVLVAHAACYACAGRSDVLRVWVTAPRSTRASRVAAALGLSDKEAAKAVRQSDAARASYLKRVHGVGEESNTDYDVVINTERLSNEAAAGLITGLAQAPSSQTRP